VNVALVLRRFTTDGGTEKYATNLARWLVGRGHEVHVYAAFVRPDLADAAGVRFHVIGRSPVGGTVGWLSFLAASSRISLSDHDVVQGFGRTVHHHVYRAGGGVHAAWLRARHPGGLGRLRLALSPGERLECAVDAAAQRRARVLVCNSEMAARQAAAFHGVAPRNIRVVRNGVDTDRFCPAPAVRSAQRAAWAVPDGGRVALFLGNGYRRKGLAIAAEAFARVAGPDDRFVIAGGDAHAERYLAPIRAALGPRVVELGPQRRPEDALAAADATVLPTTYDSAANTTLEAMAVGVPPVTTTSDGNAEIVPYSELVVRDPRDASAVGRALVSAWRLAPVAAAELRAVATAWPVSRNGEAMEAIYEELVDG
jgi:UDP-glucose:(heptosyl)LPS alpha-1,3-glucosyltransferase